jgi:RNA polymerase sigma factor (sigma-70 family)
MAAGKNRAIRGPIRTLLGVGATGALTDGQLLERFSSNRGEAAELAFAVLVERHGPMVLRVCRGVLADPEDRDDAFQATFLVLVKKARGLWVRDSLGPWLHQVAYRTASCARRAAARRRRHEYLAATSKAESRKDPGSELARVLHEEIERLPERFRAPLVLCDLEGCSHEQAARHLGCPVGSVKSRQARGRARLRERLRRRGLAPDTGLLATALSPAARNVPLPPALVDSTANAVVQFVTLKTLARSSAALLAQGVLQSMMLTQRLKVASVLIMLGATVTGAGLFGQSARPGSLPGSQDSSQPGRVGAAPDYEVTPGKLKVAVVEPGFVESSRNQDAYCKVEGQTAIISIVPEGTAVKKGSVVCLLDSNKLKDDLLNQRIASERAATAVRNAILDREVAELALREYTNGIYVHEQETLKDEIRTAESSIQKAQRRLERARLAAKQLREALAGKNRSSGDIGAEVDIEDRIDSVELGLEREQSALKIAKRKQALLENYARDKTTKSLDAEIQRKRGQELELKAVWDLEKTKELKLQRQIEACTMRAPADGTVVYANNPNRAIGSTRVQIEEGATVRERQKIFSLPDLTRMQVNAKVHESMIDRVRQGLKARIKVDAFPGEELAGVVVDVNPLPDPVLYTVGRNVYTVRVKIENARAGLRPGMSAHAEILVSELDNVLSVPLGAVIHLDGKDQVAVKKPGGGYSWREVVLGLSSSDRRVDVKQGIERGDRVSLDPLSLLTEEERKKVSAPAKPAAEPSAPVKAGAAPRQAVPNEN